MIFLHMQLNIIFLENFASTKNGTITYMIYNPQM